MSRYTMRWDHDLSKPLHLNDHVAEANFQFTTRLTTRVLQPHWCVVFFLALKAHRKQGITPKCCKFEGISHYFVQCNPELQSQGTHIETKNPPDNCFFCFLFCKTGARNWRL